MQEINVTKKELEQLDQDIIFVLNKARGKTEGQKRRTPRSKEKVKRRSVNFHWKAIELKAQGKLCNNMVIENREQCV